LDYASQEKGGKKTSMSLSSIVSTSAALDGGFATEFYLSDSSSHGLTDEEYRLLPESIRIKFESNRHDIYSVFFYV